MATIHISRGWAGSGGRVRTSEVRIKYSIQECVCLERVSKREGEIVRESLGLGIKLWIWF